MSICYFASCSRSVKSKSNSKKWRAVHHIGTMMGCTCFIFLAILSSRMFSGLSKLYLKLSNFSSCHQTKLIMASWYTFPCMCAFPPPPSSNHIPLVRHASWLLSADHCTSIWWSWPVQSYNPTPKVQHPSSAMPLERWVFNQGETHIAFYQCKEIVCATSRDQSVSGFRVGGRYLKQNPETKLTPKSFCRIEETNCVEFVLSQFHSKPRSSERTILALRWTLKEAGGRCCHRNSPPSPLSLVSEEHENILRAAFVAELIFTRHVAECCAEDLRYRGLQLIWYVPTIIQTSVTITHRSLYWKVPCHDTCLST